MNEESITKLAYYKDSLRLESGSFVLLDTPDLTKFDSTSLEFYSSLFSLLKDLGIHPILCPNESRLKNKWLEHSFVSAHLDLFGKVTLSKNSQKDFLSNYCDENYTGFFTSGSSGDNKLIIHRDTSLALAVEESLSLLKIEKGDLVICALPLFHLGGHLQFLRSNQLHSAQFKFISPKQLIPYWQEQNPRVVVGVPTQLVSAMEHDCPKTLFYAGGAKLMPHMWQRAKELNYQVISTYGLTESAGALLFQKAPDLPIEVYPSSTIRITEQGLLSFKSLRLAHSRMTYSQVIPQEIDSNQFFTTFDLAEYDPHGNLRILGRSDELIICGGENINPQEIANTLSKFSNFSNIIVKGFEHEKLGEIPILFIDPFPLFSTHQQRNKWLTQLRELFPSLRRPRVIMDIPKSAGIKPSENELLIHYLNRTSTLYYEL